MADDLTREAVDVSDQVAPAVLAAPRLRQHNGNQTSRGNDDFAWDAENLSISTSLVYVGVGDLMAGLAWS